MKLLVTALGWCAVMLAMSNPSGFMAQGQGGGGVPVWVLVLAVVIEVVTIWAMWRRWRKMSIHLVQMDRFEARKLARKLYVQRLVFFGLLVTVLIVSSVLLLAYR